MRPETKAFLLSLGLLILIVGLALLSKCESISLGETMPPAPTPSSSEEKTAYPEKGENWKFSYNGGEWTPAIVMWNRNSKEFKCGLLDDSGRWLIGKEDGPFAVIDGEVYVHKKPSGTFQLHIMPAKKPGEIFLSGNLNEVRFEMRNW